MIVPVLAFVVTFYGIEALVSAAAGPTRVRAGLNFRCLGILFLVGFARHRT
ncbi:hypothetical protein [Rhodococcoides yunnanense]|uniref:hypothetical protein n=1 Tax=Rhodococcoides yunnanense TaxID=278209 RepID=UPI0012E143BF|nr:hypothetical protein [Rhodococcus yunnanensis]